MENSELLKLLQAERKNKRYLAELRTVRKKYVQDKSPEGVKRLKMVDEEIASLLK